MTIELRSDRERLLGVREERSRSVGDLEFRKDKKSGQYILEGYAATYDPYDVHGGPSAGGWVEQLSATAFDETLAAQPDVQLLINHEGTPLARTKSGTLKLTRDRHGLRVWASLDPSDPDVQRLAPKMLRKDMTEMSFAFRVTDQDWDTSYSHRTIRSLNLEKGDVSVVNYGMNPGTQAIISDGVGALAQLSNKELVELRKLDQNQVRRAVANLMAISGAPVAPGMGSIQPGALPPGLRADKDTSKPYGNVTYADPGYKADGKKRYPIDTKDHTRAAWSYINQAKNQKGYTSGQVASIKNRIKAAAKKFGIEISEGKSRDTAENGVMVSHIEQIPRADGNMTLMAVMSDGSRVPLPSQRALPPSDKPQPDAQKADAFKGTEGWGNYNPSSSPNDPHDEPFEDGMMGTVGAGPVPDNIVGSGSFSGTPKAETHPESSAGDPHDVTINEEMLAMDREFYSLDPHDDPTEGAAFGVGSKVTPVHGPAGTALSGGDPHDTPYDLGGQAGGVPGDRPNYGSFPQGQVADNIVLTGAPLGTGSGVNPGTPPSIGTEPVDGGGEYDWTSGTVEPGDPPEQLGATRAVAVSAGGPGDHGHDTGTHGVSDGSPGTSGGSWAPTNIEAGMGSMGTCEDVDDDADEKVELDLGLADALDKTIVHAYQLAGDNTELRKVLVVGRKQLNSMRNITPKPNSDISRRLAELRNEIGEPDAGTVSEGLRFLRSAGTAPVGYGGLLNHNPGLHMVTPSERLAKEALDKERRAREAANDAGKAAERLKAAQREAELNDAIRRLKLKAM